MLVKMVRTTFMILCFIINICYIENSKEIYLINKEWSTHKEANNYSYYYSDKVHLISSKTPFYFLIEFSSEGIRCWSHLYSNEFFRLNYNLKSFKTITGPTANVTNGMSSLWNCSIKNYYKKKHYSYDVYFRVRIKDLEPPQMILINRLVLDTRRDLPSAEDNQAYVTKYNYVENDFVDVACIIQQQNCEVQMYYDYAELLDDSFGNITSKSVVGFRVKLQEKHNNSRMICSCTCKDEKTEVEVVFILQNSFSDNIMTLKINGSSVRGKSTKGDKDVNKIIYMNYAYFQNDHPSIHAKCHTNKEGIALNLSGHNYLMADTKIDGKSLIESYIQFNRATKIQFVAKNTSNTLIEEKIIMVLTPTLLNDTSGLSMNLPKENILMEAYTIKKDGNTEMRDTHLYYEFIDDTTIGDIQLPLNCSKKDSLLAATLDFNGTESDETSITKNLALRFIDNDTSLKCVLRSWKDGKLLARTRVIFRVKRIQITDSTGQMQNKLTFPDTLFWTVVMCILIIVIAILVALVINYKTKYDRLKQAKRSNDYENVKRNVEAPVPPKTTQQELIYAVLDLQNSNDAPKKKNNDTIYGKIVPNSQGQCSGGENIYANQGDMAVYTNIAGGSGNPNEANVECAYATPNDLNVSGCPNEDNYVQIVPHRK